MKIIPISQKNYKWADDRIGNSYSLIRDFGCTICALSMCLQKLRGYFCNPKNAARYWEFNNRGEIIWNKTKFYGMNFVQRIYTANIKLLAEYANSKTRAAIAEVNYGKHWVYIHRIDEDRISIIDPIDGMYYDALPSKYKLTGGAIFEQNNISPEWIQRAVDKFKNKGLDLTLPLQQLDIKELEQALYDLGIINQINGNITLGRLLVIIEKIKESY